MLGTSMKIGILCGHQIPDLMQHPEKITVHTPYGDVVVYTCRLRGHDVFFIQRHGEQGNLPPHQVNHRGNIQAFASSHIPYVISVGTVGSMKNSIQPGDFVIPHDFIDATKSQPTTFFEERRVHVDMTEPFCPSLRALLLKSCRTIKDIRVHENGVYLATQGPRLETVAEIKLYSMVADIVGMTMASEAVLAREKGMCFASVCLVCNMAAGLQKRLPAGEIASVYKKKEPSLSKILLQVIESIPEKKSCDCSDDVTKATL